MLALDDEWETAQSKLTQAKLDLSKFEREGSTSRIKLTEEYQKALGIYRTLQAEIAALEENLEDISFGLYKPHFSFSTSAEYKTAIENLRIRERVCIKDDRAAACSVHWTVGNSKADGDRMVKLNKKLLLRAFNGECDAALANVSWNNVNKMEERINKTFTAVNELGKILKVFITPEYLKLKLDEIRLAHEHENLRYQEREAQRIEREKMREEQKAAQEIEEIQEQAEAQEQTYEKLLEKAPREAAEATEWNQGPSRKRSPRSRAELDEARRKKERAIARAQLTKSGFVYVISNIGAFGEDVYKIGMTRRIEPMERIVELSGAAVPFPFDLHAMLYSDNAPDLRGCSAPIF